MTLPCRPQQEGRVKRSLRHAVRHGLWTSSSGPASPPPPEALVAYLWMVCPAGVCSTSSPACRRTSMTVLFPRK